MRIAATVRKRPRSSGDRSTAKQSQTETISAKTDRQRLKCQRRRVLMLALATCVLATISIARLHRFGIPVDLVEVEAQAGF